MTQAVIKICLINVSNSLAWRNQACLRHGRSCTVQIHTLRSIIEGFQAKVTIIDFLKASYCSINRESMFGILHRYGISIVSTISLVRQF